MNTSDATSAADEGEREPSLDELLAHARKLAKRISLDAEDIDDGKVVFDRQQMENELTEALVVFAHEVLHEQAKAELSAGYSRRPEATGEAREVAERIVSGSALHRWRCGEITSDALVAFIDAAIARAITEAVRAAEERATRAEKALREIADKERYEIALDPDWPSRIADAALRGQSTEAK